MISLDAKQQQASIDLRKAVELVQECINSASRSVSDRRMERMITQALDTHNLSQVIEFGVRKEAVDVYDGEKNADHAHVAVSQANAAPFYWRNRGETHGSHNFCR